MHAAFWGYGNVPLQITFVYTKWSYILRHSLWHDLITLLASFVGPWMVGGDFNVVRYINECFSSTPLTLPSREFRDMITDCDLNDFVCLDPLILGVGALCFPFGKD